MYMEVDCTVEARVEPRDEVGLLRHIVRCKRRRTVGDDERLARRHVDRSREVTRNRHL